MKVELVSPAWKKEDRKERSRSRVFKVPSLNLLNVAAASSEDIEIVLTDEHIEPVLYNKKPDLVGITVNTAGAPRAYEIADRFRKMNVPVVLGGPHVSYMQEEALSHADAIVAGECEGPWQQILEDFKTGGKKALKPVYQTQRRPDMCDIPLPPLDLLRKERYITYKILHITRGCPHNCSFCTVTDTFGRKIRYRPIEQIVDFVKNNVGRSLKQRLFLFTDDNIMANRKYAKKLFRALIPFNILWISQASIDSAYDEELLRLAARSGCKGLFVGLETISENALHEIGKSQNKISFYEEAIKRFHKNGIFIEGGFIFGFDADTKAVFEKTVAFVNRLQLDGVQYSALTPLPGTEYYRKIEREGRFLNKDWTNYDCAHIVVRPKKMSSEELTAGLHWAYKNTYNLRSIVYRSIGAFKNRRRYMYAIFLFLFNLGHRFSCKRMFKSAWNPNRRKPKRILEILHISDLIGKIAQLPNPERKRLVESLRNIEGLAGTKAQSILNRFFRLRRLNRIEALFRLPKGELRLLSRVLFRFEELNKL